LKIDGLENSENRFSIEFSSASTLISLITFLTSIYES